MAPVKFDDIPKVATEVLADDYQTSGYVLKAKQKTSWGGAVLSTQVDVLADDKCATPSKLTWKLPVPFGCPFICVDKLEMDKGGKYKLEASTEKAYPGLKVEVKSDLADLNKTMVGCTYSGVKNLQVKMEHKLTKPQDFTGEVTYACPVAVCGVKFNQALLSGGLPDFGVRFLKGPFFASITAKEKLAVYTAHCMYQATPEVKLAASYQHGGKGSGNGSLAISCKGLYKVKVSQDQTVCCSVKHSVTKGFTVLAGAKYGIAKGDLSYGLQLSVE
mmetsp:Transcript_120787/g.338118  ORF Transcript_120787/g.338118 Transcript_120787/m.338118 type:complete len:274 (-) Transcript_120787:85-906(-)